MFKLNFKFGGAFLALAFLLAVPAISRADDALVGKIQTHYQGVSSLSGAFKQVLTHKESGSRTEQDGTLAFRKPLLVRWEVTTPKREELIVVSAKEVWDYIPGEEIVYKYPVSLVQDSRTMIKVITGQANLREDFNVKAPARKTARTNSSSSPRKPRSRLPWPLSGWTTPELSVGP